jgi:hypothetical protein
MWVQFFAAAACKNGVNTSGVNTVSGISGNGLPQICANSDTLKTVFLIAFSVIGGIAFLFLVIAGARYTLARGNPEAIQKAKNQIQYSLIGLVIAASAAAVVNFVVGRL